MVQLKPIKTWASPTYVWMALIFALLESQWVFVVALAVGLWIPGLIVFVFGFFINIFVYWLHAPAAFAVIAIDSEGLKYGKWSVKWQEVKLDEARAYVPVRRFLINAPEIPLGLSLSLFGAKSDYKHRSIAISIEKNSAVHEMFKQYCPNYGEISDEVCPSPPFKFGRGGALAVILQSLLAGGCFGLFFGLSGVGIPGAVAIGVSVFLAVLPWRIETSLVSREVPESK